MLVDLVRVPAHLAGPHGPGPAPPPRPWSLTAAARSGSTAPRRGRGAGAVHAVLPGEPQRQQGGVRRMSSPAVCRACPGRRRACPPQPDRARRRRRARTRAVQRPASGCLVDPGRAARPGRAATAGRHRRVSARPGQQASASGRAPGSAGRAAAWSRSRTGCPACPGRGGAGRAGSRAGRSRRVGAGDQRRRAVADQLDQRPVRRDRPRRPGTPRRSDPSSGIDDHPRPRDLRRGPVPGRGTGPSRPPGGGDRGQRLLVRPGLVPRSRRRPSARLPVGRRQLLEPAGEPAGRRR